MYCNYQLERFITSVECVSNFSKELFTNSINKNSFQSFINYEKYFLSTKTVFMLNQNLTFRPLLFLNLNSWLKQEISDK